MEGISGRRYKRGNVWAGPNEPSHPPGVNCFGISTTSPSDVWFTQVKKQAVEQDIELLSHANLYYLALVPCPAVSTCSYHTLVRLPNLVKPDHCWRS
jgi:hypothetical protein